MVAGGPKGIAWLARRKADEAGTEMGFRRATGDGRCVKVAASEDEGRRATSGHRGIRVLGERCEVRGVECGVDDVGGGRGRWKVEGDGVCGKE